MHDPVGLLFASANVGLSILILGIVLYGVRYFKKGLLVKTLDRAQIAAVFLFLYFLTESMVVTDVLPANTPIDDVLGTFLMFSLIYLAYGYINDWKTLA